MQDEPPFPWRCHNATIPPQAMLMGKKDITKVLPQRVRAKLQPYSMAVLKKTAGSDRVSGRIKGGHGWEMELTTVFADHLISLKAQRKTVHFLDVGTNLGWFTLLAAALNASVISIEPNANNVQMVRTSICANHWPERVRLHQVAAGSRREECALIQPTRNVGDTMLACGDVQKEIKVQNKILSRSYTKGEMKQVGGMVQVRKLDDIVASRPIDVVKIDVEGFEGDALGGWQAIFSPDGGRRIPTLALSEFQPRLIRKRGHDPERYLRFFGDRNYSVFSTGMLSTTGWDVNGNQPFPLTKYARRVAKLAPHLLKQETSDLIFYRPEPGTGTSTAM